MKNLAPLLQAGGLENFLGVQVEGIFVYWQMDNNIVVVLVVIYFSNLLH